MNASRIPARMEVHVRMKSMIISASVQLGTQGHTAKLMLMTACLNHALMVQHVSIESMDFSANVPKDL